MEKTKINIKSFYKMIKKYSTTFEIILNKREYFRISLRRDKIEEIFK